MMFTIIKLSKIDNWILHNKYYCLKVVSIFFFCCTNANAQTITTIAGIGLGPSSGDGTPAISAHVPNPAGGNFDSHGNYYFGQSFSSPRVRMINTSGIINTVAGNGIHGYNGDGILAISAQISFPSITVDTMGNIYIADRDNYRVRKVDATTGIINTIAGIGYSGPLGDGGLATSASVYPYGLCLDAVGNLYVIDSGVRIRRINTTGIITTIAGTGIGGFSGDSGLAVNANLAVNYSICMDATSSNLYIGCATRIRKINMATGIITTVAGDGTSVYTGDGIPATSAQFSEFGIYVDVIGRLFIADYGNQRIRMVDTFGIIYTIAGTGVSGFSGDSGLADTAKIYDPEGIVVDACGNVYIADEANNRIRKITMPPIITIPAISLSGTTTAAVGSTVTVNAVVSSAGSSYLVHWMNDGVEFSETTVPFVTYTKTAAVDTITARIVPTGYGCWDSTTSAGWVVTNSAETSPQPSPKERELSVFPNPVRDVLQVAMGSSSGQSYRLLNMIGGVIQQGALHSGKNMLQVQALPMGIYVLEVADDKGDKMIKKIVKE